MYSDSNVAHLYVCLCLTVDTALHLFALYLIGDVFFAAEESSIFVGDINYLSIIFLGLFYLANFLYYRNRKSVEISGFHMAKKYISATTFVHVYSILTYVFFVAALLFSLGSHNHS
jgi:hypothetical protein